MSQPSAEYTISLDRVTKRFGGRPVVDDLSFRVRRGTTLGFIGLNGAGKTTAIRMMVGLLAPDAGRIEIDGVPHERDRADVKARIGYVPDRPNVYPWMRIGEAIAFARSFHPRWNERRCRELVRMFRLDPTLRAGQLSKGQAAKLSLLLAIAHDPPVLILDEPTNGLDPLVRDEFLEGVLATAGEQDQTVLFSSHALGEVHRLADSVAFLHEGRLLLHGDIDDLLDRTKRIRAVREDESEKSPASPGHGLPAGERPGVVNDTRKPRPHPLGIRPRQESRLPRRCSGPEPRRPVQGLRARPVPRRPSRRPGGVMNALLRKDWRLYRPTVIGCLVVLAGVYLIGVLPLLREDPKAGPYDKPRQVVNVALLAAGVTAVFAAVFGASAFAAERGSRQTSDAGGVRGVVSPGRLLKASAGPGTRRKQR
jgi:ABC-2 type transport system ATP-binding protein